MCLLNIYFVSYSTSHFVECAAKQDQKCEVCSDQVSNCGSSREGLSQNVKSGEMSKPTNEEIKRERLRQHEAQQHKYIR